VPVAVIYAVILALWFALRQRLGQIGFYLLFAVAVTASVQLVGVYLVFASLIVPALAARGRTPRHRLPVAYAVGVAGYAIGIVASALFDLPTGPVIVVALALVFLAVARRAPPAEG
jgi:zinc/manganese transport system permease protein